MSCPMAVIRTSIRTIIVTTAAMTYDEIARTLGIEVASARRLVHRKRWAKTKGNDGRAVVQVPAEALDRRHDSPHDRRHDGHDDGHDDRRHDEPSDSRMGGRSDSRSDGRSD